MRGAEWADRQLARVRFAARRALNLAGPYEFLDRSAGHDRVAVVLAGYKEWLWPFTLERVFRAAPADLDVCIVSAGKRDARLMQLAAEHGASYLWSKRNSVALVQNLAVRCHPAARWIYKLDEDIFLADGYFDRLRDGYRHVVEDGIYRPGFCAPVLNVNGYSYVTFLETLGLADDYRAEFGELRRAAMDGAVYKNAAAARWIWERTLPFDAVAREFERRGSGYSTVPHRFSIGAILYERDFWELIGGILVSPIPGRLGVDEADLSGQCVLRSRPMVVLHNMLAGHFSFGPQEEEMRPLLEERPGDFAYAGPDPRSDGVRRDPALR